MSLERGKLEGEKEREAKDGGALRKRKNSHIALQLVHELAQLSLEFTADADEGELALLAGVIGELRSEELIAALLNKRLQRSVQRVVVLLDELILSSERNVNFQVKKSSFKRRRAIW